MSRLKVTSWCAAITGLLLLAILTACGSATAASSGNRSPAQPAVTPAGPAAENPTAIAAASPVPSATRAPFSLWLPDTLPQQLRDTVQLPGGWVLATQPFPAAVTLAPLPTRSAAPDAIQWVYVLVAPFPTVSDEVSLADVQQTWKSGPVEGAPFNGLLVDPSTRAVFEQVWGPAGHSVQTLAADQITNASWTARTTWAILPFEQLGPRWKVMVVDGQSPIQKTFQPAQYGLIVSFAPQGDPALLATLGEKEPLAKSNRQADHLTTLMVTGVTALVRGTASLMEGRGLDYPAQFIGDWLREADILHVSNEIPFAENCPPPFNWEGLKFCSRPKYLQLLEEVGTDVVELTGDHFEDWGPDAVRYSLKLYQDHGLPTYAAGVNIEAARKPALLEHNGNKIAFLGCNAKPPGYATVSETTPGVLHCNMDQMTESVKQVRADGYLPVVTFQHLEYYRYEAHPILQKDFRQMADAGAVIVSGSQAHQPHALEIKQTAFLHYGLGNLFFDQTNQGFPPRTAFIDRHVIYEGRHISTELLTIYLVDYARSRPMTPEERQEMLSTVFKASGW